MRGSTCRGLEELHLRHREVVAIRRRRETEAEMPSRRVSEWLAGIFSRAARDLGDPLCMNSTRVVRRGLVCDNSLRPTRERHAAVENRTTAATAADQRGRDDDRSPHTKGLRAAVHLAPYTPPTPPLSHTRSARLRHKQNLAIAFDGRVVSKPYIDYRKFSHGICGARGTTLLTNNASTARRIARAIRGERSGVGKTRRVVCLGPLPAWLSPCRV